MEFPPDPLLKKQPKSGGFISAYTEKKLRGRPRGQAHPQTKVRGAQSRTMIENAESTILKCVAGRHLGTTCPSEVARILATGHNIPREWRKFMPVVHEAADVLLARGEITLTWKSVVMSKRAGPYRISGPKHKS